MDEQRDPAEASSPVEDAWIAERRTISRELHDDIAHLIVIMMGTLERLELYQETHEPVTRRLLSDARVVAVATLSKVRALAARLRASKFDSYQDSPSCKGAGDVATELSYVLQEAVTNALVHSGALRIVVDVKQGPDGVTAVVEDDGSGFEPDRLAPHERLGLLSMHERAALIGGQLKIDTAQDGGTRVTIYVPCREESHGEL